MTNAMKPLSDVCEILTTASINLVSRTKAYCGSSGRRDMMVSYDNIGNFGLVL